MCWPCSVLLIYCTVVCFCIPVSCFLQSWYLEMMWNANRIQVYDSGLMDITWFSCQKQLCRTHYCVDYSIKAWNNEANHFQWHSIFYFLCNYLILNCQLALFGLCEIDPGHTRVIWPLISYMKTLVPEYHFYGLLWLERSGHSIAQTICTVSFFEATWRRNYSGYTVWIINEGDMVHWWNPEP